MPIQVFRILRHSHSTTFTDMLEARVEEKPFDNAKEERSCSRTGNYNLTRQSHPIFWHVVGLAFAEWMQPLNQHI